MKTKMDFVHFRKARAIGLCDKTGVHTTKNRNLVTCQFCKDAMIKLEKNSLNETSKAK